jgi:hypothetical protein
MLYGGAVLLEGVVLWLLATGVAGWLVALAAAFGSALLLGTDWALERRTPESS